jgi:polysaccharide biosynthesis/export protein
MDLTDKNKMKWLAMFSCLVIAGFGIASAAEPQASASGPGAGSNDYVIGPGDTLQIFVWRSPELSSTVPVRPDGKISTPLVEDMIAVHKTPAGLARDIEAVLAVYVKMPQVDVIVTQALSAFSQIKVIGQVQRPQSVPYREGLTVLDVVLQVGGLMPYAAGNRAKVIRVENGKQQDIKIKLEALINQGDMKQNLALKPGDVLVIPQTRF